MTTSENDDHADVMMLILIIMMTVVMGMMAIDGDTGDNDGS